nr:MAG TPA: hypothetical protein [Caudoviricetes sp.]
MTALGLIPAATARPGRVRLCRAFLQNDGRPSLSDKRPSVYRNNQMLKRKSLG